MADLIVDMANLVARQATSSILSTSPTATSTTSPTTTSPAPSATSSDAAPASSGPQSSPLLFFVALGFGVVFTNLWIIVGVKYCFRYNARNRARLALDENGEPIPVDHPRQHRRRREKKLMTMDEVNERFPVMKYKDWVAARAHDGLPTAGGVAVSENKAESIRNGGTGIVDMTSSTRTDAGSANQATGQHSQSQESSLNRERASPPSPTNEGNNLHETKTIASTINDNVPPVNPNDDDEDDAIQPGTRIPHSELPDPGDACAICIDSLADEEDIRGLTCGHAFHASCVDPWLTNRRACCPLCKADYFTPKPRPDGMDPNSPGQGPNMPPPPHFAYIPGRRESAPSLTGFQAARTWPNRLFLFHERSINSPHAHQRQFARRQQGFFGNMSGHPATGSGHRNSVAVHGIIGRWRNRQQPAQAPQQQQQQPQLSPTSERPEAGPRTWSSRLRGPFTGFGRPAVLGGGATEMQNMQGGATSPSGRTPSQLEAGRPLQLSGGIR